jgi:hypothetical protein
MNVPPGTATNRIVLPSTTSGGGSADRAGGSARGATEGAGAIDAVDLLVSFPGGDAIAPRACRSDPCTTGGTGLAPADVWFGLGDSEGD